MGVLAWSGEGVHGNLKVGINNYSVYGKKRPALFKNCRHMKGREAPVDWRHPSEGTFAFFSFYVALPSFSLCVPLACDPACEL